MSYNQASGFAGVSFVRICGVLLVEAFSAFVVACKQKGGVVITVRHDVCSATDHFLLQAHMKFREFRPMNPGMLVVLEMKTYIEHGEVEKVRHKYGGVTYGSGESLFNTSRMLDVHARTHDQGVGDPMRQHPEP